MIRTTLILTSAAAVAVAVGACGLRIENDGPHTVRTRTVGSFHRIDLRGSTDVVINHGQSATLTVSGGRNRVRDVITRVQSGTLVVQERNSDATLHLGDDGPTVTVSTPSLVGARLGGSGDLDLGDVVAPVRRGQPLWQRRCRCPRRAHPVGVGQRQRGRQLRGRSAGDPERLGLRGRLAPLTDGATFIGTGR
jgi:Putative auto-transporter adhesin, head GIN domain